MPLSDPAPSRDFSAWRRHCFRPGPAAAEAAASVDVAVRRATADVASRASRRRAGSAHPRNFR